SIVGYCVEFRVGPISEANSIYYGINDRRFIMKVVCLILALLIGVGVIFLGVDLVLKANSETVSCNLMAGYDVGSASFGADFYSYMYDASDNIVSELNDIIYGTGKIVTAQNNVIKGMYKIGGNIVIVVGLSIIATSALSLAKIEFK
ncbi:MAG: hypothetical protein IJD67_03520, partial [Clostridia bacterium]|nr:hypothetical protein [Clostridia bacterium]